MIARLGLLLVLLAWPLDLPHAQPFRDVTSSAGISYNQYVNVNSFPQQQHHMTGGAAAVDYDRDGWVDLYVTRMDAPDILYRNQGNGRFVRIPSATTGIARETGSNGAAWCDIENDGDSDLYVTTVGVGRNFLYINDGQGVFVEDAVARGVDAPRIDAFANSFSVSFGDYDRDGLIDMHTTAWDDRDGLGTRLFHNNPQDPGHFDDVTVSAGVAMDDIVGAMGRGKAWAFASHFSDLDNDGRPDLAIAGDFNTSRLFWNNGDGTFQDGTNFAGVGTDENGMGSTIGDINGDGLLDWFVTSIFDTDAANTDLWGQTGNRLYMNTGSRRFTDITQTSGVRDGAWGWGACYFDFDNDGHLDIVMTNGMRVPFSDTEDSFNSTPMRLWRGHGDGTFATMSDASGVSNSGSGKGLLTFDYDRDGDLDFFAVNNGDRPVLYRNDYNGANNWLRVMLRGVASNSAGLGSRIELTVGGRKQYREVRSGTGFLSQNQAGVWFGLGDVAAADSLTIKWPSGTIQKIGCVGGGQTITITEGEMPNQETVAGLRARIVERSAQLDWAICNTDALTGFNVLRKTGPTTYDRLNETIIAPSIGAQTYRIDLDTSDSGKQLTFAIEAVSATGGSEILSEVSLLASITVPSIAVLSQNFPNPFGPQTTIDYSLAEAGEVILEIYRVDGARVKTLVNSAQPAGPQAAIWDGTDAAGNRVHSGIYFYRLTANGATVNKKMTLVR